MAHFPEWIDPTEARTINRFLTLALSQAPGVRTLRVFDGEDFATDWTRNRAAIQRATAQTGFTVIHVAETSSEGSGRTHLGTVSFIHGNGEDVLSDWSHVAAHPDAENIMARLCEHDT